MTSKHEKNGTIKKGMRFGRLVARARDPKNPRKGAYWWFYCDCGSYTSIRLTSVLSGRTQSCGCKKKDYLRHRASEVVQLKKALVYAKKHLLPHQVKHVDRLTARKE